MRYLYSALLYGLLPLTLGRLLWRSRRAPAYRRRLGERFGRYSQPAPGGSPVIWVHAVSVGEVAAGARLVERLLANYPGGAVIVTTTTPTGSQRVRTLFGDRVSHVYCPWDLPGAVRRFLGWARPDMLLLLETELWPNLLYLSRARGCRTVLVNGRLSQRSADRYARLPGFSRWLVGQLDAVVCQSDDDSKRFLALGVPGERQSVSGNLKWDARLDASTRERGERLRAQFADTETLLAASTHSGEEQAVLTAFVDLAKARPGCRLVLVPRHPERAKEVAALCTRRGLRVARLSQGLPAGLDSPGGPDVLLVDTIGDLAALYAVATVAFVGGSLVPVGGHNPLEAVLWDVPVASGPHIRNFEGMYGALEAAGGAVVAGDEEELLAAVLGLMQDPARRARVSGAARGVIEAKGGALERVLAVVAAQFKARSGAGQLPAAVGGGGSSR